ncbi:hypothetical protein M758_5G038400 [Ceratodon purpureus]|nr:hypothetical protein M758_5G038400 [Ceratodon purpureus]
MDCILNQTKQATFDIPRSAFLIITSASPQTASYIESSNIFLEYQLDVLSSPSPDDWEILNLPPAPHEPSLNHNDTNLNLRLARHAQPMQNPNHHKITNPCISISHSLQNKTPPLLQRSAPKTPPLTSPTSIQRTQCTKFYTPIHSHLHSTTPTAMKKHDM